jgi:translation elongation factor EF-G
MPRIREPVMRVRVALPGEFLGDVMGDLNTRRASIVEMQPGTDLQHIVAFVPQPELINYATDLRTMTEGRASFEAEFSHFQFWGNDDDASGGPGVRSPLKPIPPTLSAGAAAEPASDQLE